MKKAYVGSNITELVVTMVLYIVMNFRILEFYPS